MHPPARVAEHRAAGWWTDETVQGLLADRVAEAGDRLAIVDPPDKATHLDLPAHRWTWAELDRRVDALAATLLDAGVGEGDVLAVQLPNSAELAVAYLAAWRVRAIVSPVPVQYRRHELVSLARTAGVAAVLTADRIGSRAAAAEAVGLGAEVPSLGAVLHHGPTDVAGSVPVDRSPGDVTSVAAYADDHPVDPNDCITICWTSGTESRPKGVPRAHHEWLVMSRDTVAAPGLHAGSRILNPFPMVNMAGISGVLLPWLRTGCLLVQHHPFDLATFLAQIGAEGITYTLAPPAVLAMLLQRPELLAATDLSTLRQIGSGSAPLQGWMVRGWHDRHGIDIINFFGSNEGIALLTDVEVMTDPDERAAFFPRYGAPGVTWSTVAAGCTEVRLVDPATGGEVTGPGLPGELRLKGPSVFAGYLDADGVADPFDADGWLRTGDLFAIDGDRDQYLRYVDRARDVIIRGGVNIAPAEVEGLVAGMPQVAEVAVVGYPDDVMGERVCAVVVPRPGATVTLEEVTTHLRSLDIAAFKLPERLEVRPGLPRNPVGKVLKRELRAELGGGSPAGQAP